MCSLVRNPSWELWGNPVLSMPMGNPVEHTANISIIIALTQDK